MSGSMTVFSRGENPLRADKLNLAFSERVKRSGDIMAGTLQLFRDPQISNEAATKAYVDSQIQARLVIIGTPPPEAPTGGAIYGRQGSTQSWQPVLPIIGGTLTGDLTMTAGNFYGAGGIAKPPVPVMGGGLITGGGIATRVDYSISWNGYRDATTNFNRIVSEDGYSLWQTVRSLDGAWAVRLAQNLAAGTQVLDATSRQFIFDQAGNLTIPGKFIAGNTAPGGAGDVTTKAYVDAQDAMAVPKAGGTMTGTLILAEDPVFPNDAATKHYVDTHAGSGGGGIADAPSDGKAYSRRNAAWTPPALINVKDYGALLDGAATDNAAFASARTAAIAAVGGAASAGGPVVYVPPGRRGTLTPPAFSLPPVMWKLDGLATGTNAIVTQVTPGDLVESYFGGAKYYSRTDAPTFTGGQVLRIDYSGKGSSNGTLWINTNATDGTGFLWNLSSQLTVTTSGGGQPLGIASTVRRKGGNTPTWQYFGQSIDSSGQDVPGSLGAQFIGFEQNLVANGSEVATSYWAPFSGGRVGLHFAYANYIPPIWLSAKTYVTGDVVTSSPVAEAEFVFTAQNNGTSGGTPPPWPTTQGGTVLDNNITWIASAPIQAQVSRVIDISSKVDATGRQLMVGAPFYCNSPVYDAVLEMSTTVLRKDVNPNAAGIRMAAGMPIDWSGNGTSAGQNDRITVYDSTADAWRYVVNGEDQFSITDTGIFTVRGGIVTPPGVTVMGDGLVTAGGLATRTDQSLSWNGYRDSTAAFNRIVAQDGYSLWQTVRSVDGAWAVRLAQSLSAGTHVTDATSQQFIFDQTGDLSIPGSFYGAGGIAKPGDPVGAYTFVTAPRLTVPLSGAVAWNSYKDASGTGKYSATGFAASIAQNAGNGSIYITNFVSGSAGVALGANDSLIFDQSYNLIAPGNIRANNGIFVTGDDVGANNYVSGRHLLASAGGLVGWSVYMTTAGVVKYAVNATPAGLVSVNSSGVMLFNVYPSGAYQAPVPAGKSMTFDQTGALTVPGNVLAAGGTIIGNLTINGTPSAAAHAATKGYVDGRSTGLPSTGGTFTGPVIFQNAAVTFASTLSPLALNNNLELVNVTGNDGTANATYAAYTVSGGATWSTSSHPFDHRWNVVRAGSITAAEGLRLTAKGNMLLNLTEPANAAGLNDAGRPGGAVYSLSMFTQEFGMNIYTDGTNPFLFSAGYGWRWKNSGFQLEFYAHTTGAAGSASAGALAMYIDMNKSLAVYGVGYQPGGGSWSSLSDAMLKVDVADYAAGLAQVRQLRPVSYKYNGAAKMPTDRVFHGLIAQEVQPIMPEMVSTNSVLLSDEDTTTTDVLSLNSTPLVFALVNAVQELLVRVEALETQVLH